MDDLNMERQEYENTLQELIDTINKKMEQDAQILHNQQHPVRALWNGTVENVQAMVKWCDEQDQKLAAKIDEAKAHWVAFKKDLAEKGNDMLKASGNAIVVTYEGVITNLQQARDNIRELKEELLSKMKDLASKPINALRDGISYIKEFIEKGKEKLNQALSASYEKSAKDREESILKLTKFSRHMHDAENSIKNAIQSLTNPAFSPVEKPYVEPKFVTKWKDSLQKAADKDREQATKYHYKAVVNDLKANMESDNRAFRNMDVGFER